MLWEESNRHPASIVPSTDAAAPTGLAVKEPARDALHLLPLF